MEQRLQVFSDMTNYNLRHNSQQQGEQTPLNETQVTETEEIFFGSTDLLAQQRQEGTGLPLPGGWTGPRIVTQGMASGSQMPGNGGYVHKPTPCL